MKKMLAVLLACGVLFAMTGCTTMSTVGGVAGGHGLISGFGAGSNISNSGSKLASYTVWLGLFDSGFPSYLEAVKKADSDGKQVYSVTKWYYFFNTTTAYIK